MECFVAFLVMLVVIAVLIAVSAGSRIGQSQRHLLGRQIAGRFHGTYQAGGWFSCPSVHFRHGQNPVRLDLLTARGTRPAMLQLSVPWFGDGLGCEIVSNATFPGIRWGGDGLDHFPVRRLGTWFDQAFEVHGADADEVRRTLNEGVQWQLRRLRDFQNCRPLLVRVQSGRVLIRKFFAPQYYGEMEQFVCLGLELFDQLMLTRSVGIEFLEAEEAQVLQDVRCQVCGDEITSDLVFCRRCKTPHHHECWQYTGVCSTFGCREKAFEVPRVARLTERSSGETEDGRDRGRDGAP